MRTSLSYDELARSSQALGALNTLPLELQAMQTNATTPVIYALGTLTTALSLVVIGLSLTALWWLRARQASRGSDAGKGHGLSASLRAAARARRGAWPWDCLI
jgi:putative spermidine/putrescine transport system permease protein